MFTGIVQSTGQIESFAERGSGRRVVVDCTGLDLQGVQLGESIAVSGACLTVVEIDGPMLSFDLSRETLECTTLGKLTVGSRVNLERALRVGDRMGGHFVTGHVDGVGVIGGLESENLGSDGAWVKMNVTAPPELARYLAAKGSVTLDGVSLTINATRSAQFELMLVPHTLERTTLGSKCQGDPVNLEVDLLARYLEGLQSREGEALPSSGD